MEVVVRFGASTKVDRRPHALLQFQDAAQQAVEHVAVPDAQLHQRLVDALLVLQ